MCEVLQCCQRDTHERTIIAKPQIPHKCLCSQSSVLTLEKLVGLEILYIVTYQYVTCKDIITEEFLGASIHIGEMGNREMAYSLFFSVIYFLR